MGSRVFGRKMVEKLQAVFSGGHDKRTVSGDDVRVC